MADADADIRSTYRSHTHEEHIYKVPDTYIGSAEKDTVPILVYDCDAGHIIERDGDIVPGLYKVFDEVLVNALDHHTRLSSAKPAPEYPVKTIKVSVNKETGELDVWNDGMGIDVIEHPDEGVYIPEMIFGKLLTSTNYSEDDERVTGGKNGYGAKLANIFAKEFTVTTVDSVRGKRYSQTWKDNMKIAGKPSIRASKTKPYTHIKWTPDYERFGLTSLPSDMFDLFYRRVLDCAAWCGTSVKVKFNGAAVPCKNILQYAKLVSKSSPVVQLKSTSRWEVLVSLSEKGEGFRQVSFVNGIHTSNGGRHVSHVLKQLVDGIGAFMQKKTKKTVRPSAIRDNLLVVVRSTIVNPSFKSQTKDELTTPVSKMGSRWEIGDKDVGILFAKTDLMDRLVEVQTIAEDKAAAKTDGKKRSRVTGIPKLEDASLAGTKDSKKCTLLLTEGDSAATTAISGLKVIGRDLYGVYPLKGKFINAKNASQTALHNNGEIQDLKKILGLETGKKYTDVSSLRYGKIMIMTDQDHDGSHIKGLVMNMFHAQWPELLTLGFVVSMLTPIVKAKRGSEERSFYTLYDYETWASDASVRDARPTWSIKYYKGLGTSTPAEAREYFRSLRGISYDWDARAPDEMDMAFKKGFEDRRKTWISEYNPSDVLKLTGAKAGEFKSIPVSDFVNKELIAYSYASNLRAIPSVVDGLKVSQRKILFSCFKRNLVKEIRVAQLAGYVSEHAAYHHGEASLTQTIVGMAHTFVGSNNINLLEPVGQFGSRLLGGKDSASPRYIHTHLAKITRSIYIPADDPVLKHLDDDGLPVEPEWYAPIIPMLLVNGAEGIGTGYSTSIPSFNPLTLVEALKARLTGSDPVSIGLPWWRGYTGTVKYATHSTTKVLTRANIRREAPDVLVISELPIKVWTKTYRQVLEKVSADTSLIRDIIDDYNDIDVKITIHFNTGCLDKILKTPGGKAAKILHLENAVHLSNMWAYDSNGTLRKYSTPDEILDEYYTTRLALYATRKEHQLTQLARAHAMISAKAAFILAVRRGEFDLRTDDSKILAAFQSAVDTYPPLDEATSDALSPWKYLLSMSVRSLTDAKRDALLREKESIEKQIENLEKSSPESIWLSELSAFESAYATFMKERTAADRAIAEESAAATTTKKKTSNRRRRVRASK